MVFTGGLTASQQAVFTAAAAQWASILTGDIPDVSNSGAWGTPVDDVRIYASGIPIDGVSNVLGQAGPEYIRSSGLPISGSMEFDTADLANMETNGRLQNVIVHEMGHVLGVGTTWGRYATGTGGADPQYVGPNALAEYRRLSGNTAATGVPIENTGGAGTRDGHWRESTFSNELMTGWLNVGANPLSRITAGAFQDMGYAGVNPDAADLFSAGNALPTVGALSSTQAGSTLTLSLNSAVDSNGSVASVNFYRETNGIPGLQATGSVAPDTLVATDASAGYAASLSTTGLAVGSAQTFYARASDNAGAFSAVATATTTVAAATVPAPSADFNADGKVDFSDLLVLSQSYGSTGAKTFAQGDANRDGTVNFADLLILSQSYAG